ncbi:FecR family protein 18 [Sterolibacterium denitrificans]|uniref:Uncharacterized protein n=2 Tax=Sterolibacterium denitrificans TaxID=157592 RepID=A0A656Z766_9PROT|nr:FecR domain-containing protein [Sterolibacterium denitrificans]KYC28957.1 hypothetical protein ACY05_03680 [Sterolibacterium denitrificans]SMB23126.1 FecR family protein 18 [Sterolibacterium denitrificans]
MNSPAAMDGVAQQAAEWIVRLGTDDPQERQAAASGYAAWQAADPRHAVAAERLEKLMDGLEHIRRSGTQETARKALRAAPDAAWTRLQGSTVAILLVCALALSLSVWQVWQDDPAGRMLANLRTERGEWASHTLDDGSRLSLGGASEVSLDFNARQRTVKLLQGAILVNVASEAGRPFVVETEHGRIRALGTRFLVSKEAGCTRLGMRESRVEVRAAPAGFPAVVRAGESLAFGPACHEDPLPQPIDADLLEAAWQTHQMVVRDRPLGEVLDALARQRYGYIHYDREAIANIRVSAVLSLTDTDRSLQLLANSFPALRIRSLTPYLVVVSRKAER